MGLTLSSEETPVKTETVQTETQEVQTEEIQKQYKYGWRKDSLDPRDYRHKFEITDDDNKKVDLRDKCPPIYDQGLLGSCTANGIACAYQFDELKQKEVNEFLPSRLFIYYNERQIEGTVDSDSGAEIRDGIKSINQTGVCNEKDWPYDISKFKIKPPQNCYDEAKNCKSVEYKRVDQTIDQMKAALNNGFPIVFGFVVYESFEKISSNGVMPMPKNGEQIKGGHCVVIVGYDDDMKTTEETGYFIVRNSWGTGWGDKGCFYMPYQFTLNSNYCSDFWTVTKVD